MNFRSKRSDKKWQIFLTHYSKLRNFVFKRLKSKVKPIEDKISFSETTSVSQNNLSLNERNVELIEDNYRRDSFDDRFCDDLSEVLLQFLSFEDKLRFECVSKQFQRTVFQRQYKLKISLCPDYYIVYLKSKISISNTYSRTKRDLIYYHIEDQSMHSFKALLKKCSNTKSIKLQEPDLNFRIVVSIYDKYARILYDRLFEYNRICGLFEQMANYCQNLKSIGCGFVIYDKNSDIRQFLTQLNAFPALKRLNLCLYLEKGHNIDVNELFSFELSKSLRKITHLTLDFDRGRALRLSRRSSRLNKKHINSQEPPYLEIKDIVDETLDGVTQMSDILRRKSQKSEWVLETRCLKFKLIDYNYKTNC